MVKFALGTPVIIGSFPALALQYRRGDVQEATDAVYQRLDLNALYAMKGSNGATIQALDDFRKQDVPENAPKESSTDGINPLSYYVGRVTRTVEGHESATPLPDLERFIQRETGIVTSLTRELVWNTRTGLARVDTRRSQGATGFLAAAGTIHLADVTIEAHHEFGSILVISLDGQPLSVSKKVLIQATTEDQPYGFRVEDGKIASIGSAPYAFKAIDATVRLKLTGDGATRIVALDENGYATEKPVETSGDGVQKPLVIRLRGDSLYHVVLR
jgi:hypothetical protein